MLQSHHRLFHRTNLTTETGIALAAAVLCHVPTATNAALITQLVAVPVAWFGIATRCGLYRSHRTSTLLKEIELLGATVLGTIALVMLLGHVAWGSAAIDPAGWLLWGALPIVALRMAVRLTLRELRKRGRNFRRAIVVGGGAGADGVVSEARARRHLGIQVEGWVSFRGQRESISRADFRGSVDELQDVLASGTVDVVIVCPPPSVTTAEIAQVLELCRAAGIRCQIAPDFLRVANTRPDLEWYGAVPALSSVPTRSHTVQLAVKSALDMVGAAILLTLLAPVMACIAIAIKLDTRGPVFFRQSRVGRGGATFGCWKFRTMCIDAEAKRAELDGQNEQDGPVFKIKHDPRITRVGAFLRKYSLDELPQLFNVLRGEMSLVGPRPPIPAEVDNYEWWQRRRVSVRPGLTCIWQVQGRNQVSFQEWMEMDLEYLENWSLWLDFKILCGTAGTVLRGTGV